MSRAPGSDGARVRLFGSLCALVFLVNFGRVVFAPLVGPLQADFAVSDATIGLVATLAWLGSALPRVPTGYLLTRVDRHVVVLWTGALLAASAAATTAAPTIEFVMAGAFVVGVSSGAYFVAANPLISELFPDRVGRVVGVHGTASQLAAAIAPVFVGLLLAQFDWRAPFVLLSAAAVVTTAVIYVFAGRTDLPEAGTADRHLFRGIRRQWQVVLLGVVIVGVTGLVWNGFFNFYIKYLTETKDIAQPTAQTLLTVVFSAGVPAFWYTGRLADRFRHVPLMLAVLGGFVASLLAMTAVESLVGVALVSVVLGYAVHSLFPAIDTFLLESLPDSDRASAYAGYSGAMMVVQALGSLVVGTVLARGYAYDTVFRVGALALAAVLAALVALQATNRLPASAN